MLWKGLCRSHLAVSGLTTRHTGQIKTPPSGNIVMGINMPGTDDGVFLNGMIQGKNILMIRFIRVLIPTYIAIHLYTATYTATCFFQSNVFPIFLSGKWLIEQKYFCQLSYISTTVISHIRFLTNSPIWKRTITLENKKRYTQAGWWWIIYLQPSGSSVDPEVVGSNPVGVTFSYICYLVICS